MTFGDQFGLALYDKKKEHVTQAGAKKAEVARATTQQNDRAERAKVAFATLGCQTIEDRKVYEAQAKAVAVINGGDWVDELEKIAKELVAA
jgi:hypothetical protein